MGSNGNNSVFTTYAIPWNFIIGYTKPESQRLRVGYDHTTDKDPVQSPRVPTVILSWETLVVFFIHNSVHFAPYEKLLLHQLICEKEIYKNISKLY